MSTQDLNRMNQAIVANAQEQLRAAKAMMDSLAPEVQTAWEAYQKSITEGLSKEVQERLYEDYRKMKEDFDDATDQYYST